MNPYIVPADRSVKYDELIEDIQAKVLSGTTPKGDCNYIISRIVAGVFKEVEGRWRYTSVGDAIDTFECAKLEFYRRIGAPYEDLAIEKNGDIPEYTKEGRGF